MAIKYKPHQKKCITHGLKVLKKQRKDKFRINAVTGTGKTLMSIEIAAQVKYKKGLVVVSTHTTDLRDQFEKEIKKHGVLDNFYVATYQELVSCDLDIDVLIVDEVHQGGQTSEGCYYKIIKKCKPRKIISLSATDVGVDDELFGTDKYVLGLKEASDLDIINNFHVIAIDGGLVQTLSDGSIIESNKLDKLLQKTLDAEVDIKSSKSVDSLIHYSIECGIKEYLKNDKGNQAIMFVPSIKYAEWTKERFKKVSMEVTHSKVKNDAIAQFKNKEFDVLIAVRRLQEGFDYPELEIVIDCAPSYSNDARMFKQKGGRIIRKKRCKKTGRYYVINRLNKYTKSLDQHLSTQAIILESAANDMVDVDVDKSDVKLGGGVETGGTYEFSLNNKLDNLILTKKKLNIIKSEKYIRRESINLFDSLRDNNIVYQTKNLIIETVKSIHRKLREGDELFIRCNTYTRDDSDFEKLYKDTCEFVNDGIHGKDNIAKTKKLIIDKVIRDKRKLIRSDLELFGKCNNYRQSDKDFDLLYIDTCKKINDPVSTSNKVADTKVEIIKLVHYVKRKLKDGDKDFRKCMNYCATDKTFKTLYKKTISKYAI